MTLVLNTQNSVDFATTWSTLLSSQALTESLRQKPSLSDELLAEATELCYQAFDLGSPGALHQLNWILFETYESLLQLPLKLPVLRNLKNPVIWQVFQLMEIAWAQHEENRAMVTLAADTPGELKGRILRLISTHKASCHPLFDQLKDDASHARFTSFFAFDYSLNMRFFDLVALALPGMVGEAKREVVQNIWDESGRGEAAEAHTVMYQRIVSKLIPSFNSEYIIRNAGFEMLAGSNLFAHLGLNRENFYRYLGCLAATEVLDPPQYDKLLSGAKRIGIDKEIDLTYYSEHASIDIVHAAGWLDNVMTPLATNREDIAAEMLLGVAMRLNTCADYYDMLLNKLAV